MVKIVKNLGVMKERFNTIEELLDFKEVSYNLIKETYTRIYIPAMTQIDNLVIIDYEKCILDYLDLMKEIDPDGKYIEFEKAFGWWIGIYIVDYYVADSSDEESNYDNCKFIHTGSQICKKYDFHRIIEDYDFASNIPKLNSYIKERHVPLFDAFQMVMQIRPQMHLPKQTLTGKFYECGWNTGNVVENEYTVESDKTFSRYERPIEEDVFKIVLNALPYIGTNIHYKEKIDTSTDRLWYSFHLFCSYDDFMNGTIREDRPDLWESLAPISIYMRQDNDNYSGITKLFKRLASTSITGSIINYLIMNGFDVKKNTIYIKSTHPVSDSEETETV